VSVNETRSLRRELVGLYRVTAIAEAALAITAVAVAALGWLDGRRPLAVAVAVAAPFLAVQAWSYTRLARRHRQALAAEYGEARRRALREARQRYWHAQQDDGGAS